MSALHLSIPDETYQKLLKQAQLQNITMEELVTPLLEKACVEETLPLQGEAWHQAFDALKRQIASYSGRLPKNHVVDDSRESIYREREDNQL